MLADLHNHSCLSSCASGEMTPLCLAETAAANGISLLALTDHNSARNCLAFQEACRRVAIRPLFGLEITVAEGCHVLALFDFVAQALAMDYWIGEALPHTPLNEEHFGPQDVVDVDGHRIENINFYLGVPIRHDLGAVRVKTHDLGGLFIPSHINRHSLSIESQIGVLPPGAYDAIEVLPGTVDVYSHRYPGLPVITASDAHCPLQIGQYPFYLPLRKGTFGIEDIRKSLQELAYHPPSQDTP